MTRGSWFLLLIVTALISSPALLMSSGGQQNELKPQFQTSDRCVACHNGLTTPSGADVSIGFDWRASIMANSSRDPYWQASVRRGVIDQPESQPSIEYEGSVCHFPGTRCEAKLRWRHGETFSRLT